MTEPFKTVVITEANSGLGAAAVRAFTGRGNRVWGMMRTVVGITWGVDQINAFSQPRQDAPLKEMQLDTVLG